MDAFRREQKKDCNDASPHQRGRYGCPCCRKLSKLNHFKKMSRKLAKRRLKMKDRQHFEEAI
jgi:hypothetical protein